MFDNSNEILVTILAGTAILLLTSITIIFLVVIFRRKQKEYLRKREWLQENFRKELLKVQLETQEQTFHTLSQELHDNIGQVLSLVKLNVSLIERQLQDSDKESINQTKTLLNTAISDLRNISKTLNTDYVKGMDLQESVERELELLKKTQKFETYLELQGAPFSISPERRLILFRIIQESLNNIVKHAKASVISVSLQYHDEMLTIRIKDNGIGFDQESIAKGVGMLNIEHRSKMIKSDVNIESVSGEGTTITIRLEKLELAEAE